MSSASASSSSATDAYARYGRALMRKAERILRSRADAQDMVHGLFADLLQQTTSSPPLDLPYLYRAITNRCLTHLRDSQNRARLLQDHDDVLRGPIRTRCDDRTIDMDLLLKLTQTLDEPSLEVLVYRFFDDMTLEEIASTVGVARKTIARRLEAVQAAVERLSASPSSSPPPSPEEASS